MWWLIPSALAGASFGSYGRISVSTDTRGGAGDVVNIVPFGSRLDKEPYLELDGMLFHETEDEAVFRVILTPAIQGQPFHYDGEWDASFALRNLYAEADHLVSTPLRAWAGARMWRGDDVYLLDLWPMDELNLVGAGVDASPGPWELRAAVGLNRLEGEDWQVQTVEESVPGDVDSVEVLALDRQRGVAAARAGYTADGETSLRLRVYGEVQRLSEGVRQTDEGLEQALPADRGAAAGAQLSAWGWGEDGFVHLWWRSATGLAAVGWLNVPTDGFAPDLTVTAARQHRGALAANLPFGPVSVLAGGYAQRTTDADGQSSDWDDRWEACAALRPTWFFAEHAGIGLEASRQWLVPDGLNPRTDAAARAAVTRLAVLPSLQPRPASFARPQLRLQYVLSHLNTDALDLYAENDSRTRYAIQHYVGVGAEWWLNSASYR